jgi:drug/metabolite transporter (DMT)-like permease
VPVLGAATLLGIRAGGRRPDLRAWRWSLWAGACFGAHQLLFFSAIKVTSVTDVSLMNVLSPVVVALVAVPLFGERPGAGFRGWSLVAMAGAAVVVLGASGGPQGNPLGMLMAVGNVVGFAGFFLLSKRARSEIDVLPFLFGVVVVAAVTVSTVALVWGEPIGDVRARDLGLALVVAAAPGALGHFLTTWPLHRVAANLPPLLKLAQPVLAGALAYAALGEPISVNAPPARCAAVIGSPSAA